MPVRLRPRAPRGTGDGLGIDYVTVPVRPIVYNNLKTIVQTDNQVMILIEWMHWARVVRLNAEHLPEDMRSLSGESIGWWEGDTLTVDTTNFLADPGVPREGPTRGGTVLAAGHEPSALPVHRAATPTTRRPTPGNTWPKTDTSLYEYACHEGNYAMFNTLRNARYLEASIEKHGEPDGIAQGAGRVRITDESLARMCTNYLFWIVI